MARKIVRNSKGSRKTIRTYQEGGIIGGGTQSFADREDERIGDDTEGMYQKGGQPELTTVSDFKKEKSKKEKVTVTKPSRKARKAAGDSGWVEMSQAKSKNVSKKRAERMKKRGWTESKRY